MQGKAAYNRPKVVGPFPGPCASGSYVHRAALFYVQYLQRGGKDGMPPKNPNKSLITDKKVINTSNPFKSEFTLTKVRNKELQNTYEEMKSLHNVICGSAPGEALAEAMRDYEGMLNRAHQMAEEIIAAAGMPLPVPKILMKKPKPKFKFGK